MMSNKEREILEDNFNICETGDDSYIDLETWTNGGVNMFIYLDKDKSVIEQLEDYINYFDIDEEIDLHRESRDYRLAFTVRESLSDFENYLEWLKDILKQLKEVQ